MLEAMPSGAKVYRYLRVYKGKRELITIGSSTDYTLELARLKAQTINSEIVSGIDPRAQDKAAKSILQILRDTSYIGKAAFGKTKLGPMHPDLRPVKGKDQQRQDLYSICSVPEGEWICISVPPLVTSALFEAVQEQLAVNKTTRRIRSEGVKYLLQGLL